jgi:hypothetical protein
MTEREIVHRSLWRVASIVIAASAALAASACESPTCFDTNQLPCINVPAPDAGSDAADATIADGGAPSEAGTEASDDGSASSDGSTGLDAADTFDGFDGFDGWDGFVCDPTKEPSLPDACVTDASGVFVAPSGHDGAAGTMADPLLKVGDAIKMAAAGAKRVLACGGSYNEQITIDAAAGADALALYGGLDCVHGWKWTAGTPTILAPTTPGFVLTIRGLTAGVILEDFGFHALSGTNAGDSSIAVFASKANNVLLRRCDIAAGTGKNGQDQIPVADFVASAPPGQPGRIDRGSPSTSNTCNGVALASVGGAGGAPIDNGADGTDGTPGSSNKGTAKGCKDSTTGGGPGNNGSSGVTGLGAKVLASFDETGWHAANGQPGGNGGNGQGGGGGGSQSAAGGGGGGGAGGCGGAGGAAGTGGGSSIALLAYQSIVDLGQCKLAALDAGRGGNGVKGQVGQAYGNGGAAFGDACQGGRGGYGGSGGGGGGGAGGLSAGVVWSGSAPTLDGTTLQMVLVGAMGGVGAGGSMSTGASPGAAGTDGTVGAAGPVLQFP